MKHFLSTLFFLVFVANVHAQTVSINEIVADNDGAYLDEDGDDSDWIELYNASANTVSLEGYSLSDDDDEPQQWIFPDISIAPNEYLVVFCSDKDRYTQPLHTNFKIKSAGEPLILSNASGEIVDRVAPTPVAEGFALAKICGETCYREHLDEISPGADNLSVNVVTFSKPSGAYPDPIQLTLTESLDREIHYTLNGSTPDADSPVYTEPIEMGDATDSPTDISGIPTSPFWEFPTGTIEQVNVIRARAFDGDEPVSQTFSKTYGVGDAVEETFANYPVFSIQTDPENFFDPDSGIYVPGVNYDTGNQQWSGNYFKRGSDWERNVDIAYFVNGDPKWAQRIGVRIHGGKTRNAPQKSLRLYARAELGAAKFNYPFFETKSKTVFDKLLLRCHFGGWNRTVIKDEVSAYIVRDLDFESQHAQPCVVFINGEYWGLFAIRDYMDSNFIEEEFDVEKDSVDILLNGSGHKPGSPDDWGIVEGDNLEYRALMDFLENNDMSLPGNFEYVAGKLDISSTIDYYCSEIFFAQKDWPSNNYKTWRGGGDSKWRYLFYDIDSGWGFQGPANNTLFYAADPVGSTIFNTPYATFLFRKLLESPDFVDLFTQRYACLLKNEFSKDTIDQALDRFVDIYTPGMPRNIARWHNVASMAVWLNSVDNRLYDFNAARYDYAVEHVSEYFGINFQPGKYDCDPVDDTDDPVFIPSDTLVVGIDEKDFHGNSMKIYPNPAVDWLWVDVEGQSANSRIQIFDLTGRLVYSGLYHFHKKVDVSNLKAGIYTVLISNGKSRLVGRFLRQ